MASRRITGAEVEEALAARQVTSREPARPPHTGYVLVIRATLRSGRRLKVVVPADDEGFVITLADQDEGDR